MIDASRTGQAGSFLDRSPRRDRGRGHTASLQWAPQGKATVLNVRPTESPLTCLPRSGLSSAHVSSRTQAPPQVSPLLRREQVDEFHWSSSDGERGDIEGDVCPAGCGLACVVRLAAGCDWRDYGWFQGLQPLVDAAEALCDGAHPRVKPFDTCAE